jgi:hypothetical protein
MPNIGSILKSEISRVARKEVRGETQALKKSVSLYRSQIADLKRRMQALEQQLKRVGRVAAKAAPAETQAKEGSAPRFSAKGLATQRKRLGLSAASMAKLLGATPGRAQSRSRPLPPCAVSAKKKLLRGSKSSSAAAPSRRQLLSRGLRLNNSEDPTFFTFSRLNGRAIATSVNRIPVSASLVSL